jgi:hypothetical protein
VKGVGQLGARAAVPALVDLADRLDAELIGDQGQRAVVRTDEVVAGLGLEDHGLALGAHARVDHRDEHRAARPVGRGLGEPIGALPDVEGRDLVGQVLEPERRIDRDRDAAHRRHRAVLEAEIALVDDDAAGRALGRLGDRRGRHAQEPDGEPDRGSQLPDRADLDHRKSPRGALRQLCVNSRMRPRGNVLDSTIAGKLERAVRDRISRDTDQARGRSQEID